MYYRNWKLNQLVLLACLPLSLFAQNNYWTQQFSSYTNLTGGTGMSNSNDNSVFYYNPGAIGFIDTASINVSANIYAFDRVKLKNGAGNGQDLISNRINVMAQVLAGNIYFRRAPRFRFVYGYIMRNQSRFEFEQDVQTKADFIPEATGMEEFRGKFDYMYQNGEYWGGIGLGYKINEHISVGLGHYGGFINTRNTYYQDYSIDAKTPDSISYVASISQRLKYNVNHMYILFKPGIDLRFGKHKIGIAAMLPSVRIYGRAKMYQSLETGNLHIYGNDSTNILTSYPNVAIIGDQRKVKTVIKQAASVSVGYEYERKKWKVAFIMEYFFPVREYDMLYSDVPPYATPEDAYENRPIQNFMRIRTASFGVLNVGAGYDVVISKRLRLLSGFRTDFNNKVPLFRKDYKDYITSVNPQFWNYLHFSFGITIQNENRKTYIGAIYKYGFSNYHSNFANMTNPAVDNLFLGSNSNSMQASVHGVGLTIGYSIFSRVERAFKPFVEPKKKKRRTRE